MLRTSMPRNYGASIGTNRDGSPIGTLPYRNIPIPNASLVIASHKVLTLDAAIVDAATTPLNDESSGAYVHSPTRTLYMELRTTTIP